MSSHRKKFIGIRRNFLLQKETSCRRKEFHDATVRNFLSQEEISCHMNKFLVRGRNAIKVSVESDVESLVSRYERHFKVDCQLDENRAEEEIEISKMVPFSSMQTSYCLQQGTSTGKAMVTGSGTL